MDTCGLKVERKAVRQKFYIDQSTKDLCVSLCKYTWELNSDFKCWWVATSDEDADEDETCYLFPRLARDQRIALGPEHANYMMYGLGLAKNSPAEHIFRDVSVGDISRSAAGVGHENLLSWRDIKTGKNKEDQVAIQRVLAHIPEDDISITGDEHEVFSVYYPNRSNILGKGPFIIENEGGQFEEKGSCVGEDNMKSSVGWSNFNLGLQGFGFLLLFLLVLVSLYSSYGLEGLSSVLYKAQKRIALNGDRDSIFTMIFGPCVKFFGKETSKTNTKLNKGEVSRR